MEYYKLLQLEREPFSNSPDPEYFFQSEQHLGCLQKLELALRLKRGLNVVIGDVGTGKTTLCRQLIRDFAEDEEFETHLILDPAFDSPLEMLRMLHELFYGITPREQMTEAELKEKVKQLLFSRGVDQNKTLILIIDEGQKISESCVEVLRELLNYETNSYKLLQIVIFAQLEFDEILQARTNFADRINLLHHLAPMSFKDTRRMVRHRIKLSSSGPKPLQLFTLPAMWAIYRASKGYPRKIIHLCHQSMLAMIIQNRSRAGWALIRSCRNRLAVTANSNRRAYLLPGATLAVAMLVLIGLLPGFLSNHYSQESIPKMKPLAQGTSSSSVAAPESEPMVVASKAAPIESSIPAPVKVSEAPALEPPPPLQVEKKSTPDPLSDSVAIQHTSDTGTPDVRSLTLQQPPEMLGQLIVQPGDTLLELARAVYGSNRNNQLKAVISANPHIQNPNNITIGEVVRFPPLDSNPKFKTRPCYWILLEESTSLPSAMQRLSEISNAMVIPLQVIPHWHPDTGLRFHLTIKGYFSNEADAVNYSRALPERIVKSGRIISHWPEKARYYADPYAGGELNSPIHDVRQRLEE